MSTLKFKGGFDKMKATDATDNTALDLMFLGGVGNDVINAGAGKAKSLCRLLLSYRKD